jgi:hypothetical protein
MVTIVVGLLIEVGLEQAVEHIHHHHQRIEFEESLHADTEKAIQDTEAQKKDVAVALHWMDTRIGQILDALDGNRRLATRLPWPNNLFERNGAKDPDFSHASRQDLEEYLNVMLAMKADAVEFNRMCGFLHGSEAAILKGERDLNSAGRTE